MNDLRDTFKRFREAINETTDRSDGVPYTNEDSILQDTVQTAKEQFGADFTKTKNPMYYFDDDGDVVFNCVIPSLNNARVQYRYKEPSGFGVFFWTDSSNALILSDENLKTLSKINGVYKNWKQSLSTEEDIRPTQLRNNDSQA